MTEKKVTRFDGDTYIPYEKRTGNESIVYFTGICPQGPLKIYDKISAHLTGKVGSSSIRVKTRSQHHSPALGEVEPLEKRLPTASIIETNTYYEGGRRHHGGAPKTLETNGWTFAPVDILDEWKARLCCRSRRQVVYGNVHGQPFDHYDPLLALTHFKGHVQGGFGGSDKNIGIGCADGRIGKAMIHTTPGQPNQWDIAMKNLWNG